MSTTRQNVKATPMPHIYGRYIIVNSDTGEILDDAQGYGYKSVRKAYAGYFYQHPTKKTKSRRQQNLKANKAFVKRHHKIGDDWADLAFDMMKDGEHPGYQDFKELVNEIEPKFSGNKYSLYHYVLNHC